MRVLYAVLAAALLTGGVSVVAAAETTDDIILLSFTAESGEPGEDDDCPIGFTEGTLGWHPGAQIIDVQESTSLVEPSPECPLPAFATTFYAVARGTTVASRTRTGGGAFTFSTFRAVDQIVVQVCRRPQPLGPAVQCGQLVQYPTPFTGND